MAKSTEKRKAKLKVRLKEKEFDFCAILLEASNSNFCKQSSFFGIDWILNSEENYIKVLEGKYRDTPKTDMVY